MKNGCQFCESCYKCALNWDCEEAANRLILLQEVIETLPCWDNGIFYKD